MGNYSDFAVYSAQKGSRLFAYKRGNMLVAVNPGKDTLTLELDGDYSVVYTMGNADVADTQLHIGKQSFVVLQPKA